MYPNRATAAALFTILALSLWDDGASGELNKTKDYVNIISIRTIKFLPPSANMS